MPRYRVEEKTARSDKISVFSVIFPLLSLLYAEGIFAYFSESGFTVYKILFALAAGCFSAALGRITPLRVLNFIFQTLWLVLCVLLITAQFLCFEAAGAYLSVFEWKETWPGAAVMLAAAVKNLPFLVCMAAPVVLQLTVQRAALLRRRSLFGTLLGSDWMELLGMLLLALILSFVSVTLAMHADTGENAPRRQIETEYIATASAETFGVLPQTALDLKFNVLHIENEEVVRHYIVTEDGQQVEITAEEAAAWSE